MVSLFLVSRHFLLRDRSNWRPLHGLSSTHVLSGELGSNFCGELHGGGSISSVPSPRVLSIYQFVVLCCAVQVSLQFNFQNRLPHCMAIDHQKPSEHSADFRFWGVLDWLLAESSYRAAP